MRKKGDWQRKKKKKELQHIERENAASTKKQ